MNEEELKLLEKIVNLPRELNIEIRGLILAEVVLREENQQLKEQLQQKEDIINKANKYVINHLKQDMLSDFTGANYIQEYIEEPDGLVEILDNKGE